MLVEVPFEENTDIKKGTPVFSHFNRTGVTTSSSGKFMGIVAEDYTPEKDELGLNPKSGTAKLLVNVSRESVYETDARVVVTVRSSQDRIVYFDIACGERAPAGIKGAKCILIEKAEGSTNPYDVGTVFTIFQTMKGSDGMQYWFDEEPGCCAGDKYLLMPNFGFGNLNIGADGEFTFDFQNQGNILVIGSDAEKRTVTLKFKETV